MKVEYNQKIGGAESSAILSDLTWEQVNKFLTNVGVYDPVVPENKKEPGDIDIHKYRRLREEAKEEKTPSGKTIKEIVLEPEEKSQFIKPKGLFAFTREEFLSKECAFGINYIFDEHYSTEPSRTKDYVDFIRNGEFVFRMHINALEKLGVVKDGD